MGLADRLELKIPPVVVGLLVLVAMRAAARWSPPLPLAPERAEVLSIVLVLAGAWFAIAGVWQFRRHRTTVDPVRPDRASALVDRGVFAVSRNPMYLGLVLVLLAAALDSGALWSLPGPLVLAAWLGRFQIRPEERILRQRFGAAFDAYCRRVPRWLGVPRT